MVYVSSTPSQANKHNPSQITPPQITKVPDLATVTRELAEVIGEPRYDMWFGQTKIEVKDATLIIQTDSHFVARWIDTHFATEIKQAAAKVLGESADVKVNVQDLADKPASTDEDVSHDGGDQGKSRRANRRVSFTTYRKLGDYIVGASNKLAYSAACRLVDDAQRERSAASISPLFIHGDCGVGKTHLLQGICQRFTELHQNGDEPVKVRYVTGEQFTNEYISAIRNETLNRFRQRVRKLDLLAIDDVHFLSNKVRTQSEFLHTLDAIDLSGARIVLASDEHPRQIKRFSQALISRFLSGMVVQIEGPDRQTRLELIDRLAAARGLQLSEPAVDTIATQCVGSVRELEGAITKLTAMHALNLGLRDGETTSKEAKSTSRSGRSVVGTVLVDQLFSDRTWQPAAPIRMSQVIDVVCEQLQIARADLMGSGRHRKVVVGRALVAHLGREMTTHSYPEIAQSLGRTYHSTVHTAASRLRRQMDDDELLELGRGEPPVRLRDLVDRLRHCVLRAARNG